ncbi:LysR family transcriptional regulator [Tropicimonas sp.]|uniref:LysR family transcriptional regulator n=1 Tax=Tropicimonas sp. TaxID=2067044 RepID=UPI003A8C076D
MTEFAWLRWWRRASAPNSLADWINNHSIICYLLLKAGASMPDRVYDDIAAFIVVAREQSFTKAAKKMGVSQSALSQTVRNLEERLQMRLLSRTTRKVSPTELGQQLLEAAEPRLQAIADDLNRLRGLSEQPAGTVRISASSHPTETILWPKLAPLMAQYPDLKIEIDSNAALVDIVGERFDAGVRLGEQVDKDMISVAIGPPERMLVVASRDYLERFGTPQHPRDLTSHECIQIRMPTARAPIPWEFKKGREEINVRVSGRIICNNRDVQIDAARRGFGLAWMLQDFAVPLLETGEMVSVLSDWCAEFPGFFLYYPSRHQHSRAFDLVVKTLRWRG